MLTAVTVLAPTIFAAIVLRRLKRDIAQENEFRSKLSTLPRIWTPPGGSPG
jgi:hypothetical protein